MSLSLSSPGSDITGTDIIAHFDSRWHLTKSLGLLTLAPGLLSTRTLAKDKSSRLAIGPCDPWHTTTWHTTTAVTYYWHYIYQLSTCSLPFALSK
ncbi:hypothetical protein E4U35_007061 [Claviceps purpurea]|nr:hypothetical protein E4U35_007061 [Claviceps purpurea]